MLSDLESNYYYDNNVLALDREEKLNFYMQDDLGSVMGLSDSEEIKQKDCIFQTISVKIKRISFTL